MEPGVSAITDSEVDRCEITFYPAKVLATKADPVAEVNDTVRRLVDKMGDIMTELKGVGLAAPQVGLRLRLFVVNVEGGKDDLRAFINPTIRPHGDMDTKEEGCLSIPGIYTKIRRYKNCDITATGLDGEAFTATTDGLYARVIQHEFDHLEGVTIIDRMGQVARMAHRRQIKKLEDQAAAR